jgi:hypothetical protein
MTSPRISQAKALARFSRYSGQIHLRLANKGRVCSRHDPAANGVRSRDARPKVPLDNAKAAAGSNDELIVR